MRKRNLFIYFEVLKQLYYVYYGFYNKISHDISSGLSLLVIIEVMGLPRELYQLFLLLSTRQLWCWFVLLLLLWFHPCHLEKMLLLLLYLR